MLETRENWFLLILAVFSDPDVVLECTTMKCALWPTLSDKLKVRAIHLYMTLKTFTLYICKLYNVHDMLL